MNLPHRRLKKRETDRRDDAVVDDVGAAAMLETADHGEIMTDREDQYGVGAAEAGTIFKRCSEADAAFMIERRY